MLDQPGEGIAQQFAHRGELGHTSNLPIAGARSAGSRLDGPWLAALLLAALLLAAAQTPPHPPPLGGFPGPGTQPSKVLRQSSSTAGTPGSDSGAGSCLGAGSCG